METTIEQPKFVTDEERRTQVLNRLQTGDRGLSFTSLKQFKGLHGSPKKFLHYLMYGSKTSSAMDVSNLAHCMFLEGFDAFDSRYIKRPKNIEVPSAQGKRVCLDVIDGVSFNDAWRKHYSTRGKSKQVIAKAILDFETTYKEYAKFMERAGERKIISCDDFDLAVEIGEVLMRDPLVCELIGASEKEIEFDKHMIEGVPFKGWIDIARPDDTRPGMYAEGGDLKVYANVHPKAFYRQIFNDFMHVQSALYCTVAGIPLEEHRWYIIAADKNLGNVQYQVYHIAPDVLHWGHEILIEIIQWFKHCRRLNAWNKSYGFFADGEHDIYDVHRPSWSLP